MIRIFLLINLSLASTLFPHSSFAEEKTIAFDYLMQTWICSKDDDNIDGCENNVGTGRKPASITIANIGDGIWAGATTISDSVNGLNMSVFIRAFEAVDANDTFELFVSFSDDNNKRPTLGTMSINGLSNWNSLFSIFNRPFKKGGFNYYPEIRLMAKGHKLKVTTVSN